MNSVFAVYQGLKGDAVSLLEADRYTDGQDGGGCKGLTLGTEAGALEEETGTGRKVDTEADPSAAGLLISVAVKFLLGALIH